MQFGNLSGLINGTEKVVFDYEVTGSPVASVATGSILNGNEDCEYLIIVRSIDTASNYGCFARLNNDSGTNYGVRATNGNSTTITDRGYTSFQHILFNDPTTATGIAFGVVKLYAKSGAVRLGSTFFSSRGTGTSPGFVDIGGVVWNDTSTNITSITFLPSAGNLNVGTRITILKTNNFTNGTPTGVITTPYIQNSWIRVGSTVVGTAVSSVTFSGLDGNTDVMYLLTWGNRGGGASGTIRMTFNTDTSTNYGEQYITAASTTVLAARNTGLAYIRSGYAGGASQYNSGYCLIYAKSGFERSVLSQFTDTSSGTTVGNTTIDAHIWNNTSSNITQIVLTDPNAGSQILTGSQFNLYALRPS